MIGWIKLKMKARHEKRIFTLLESMVKRKDLLYEMQDLRVPCPNPFHYHTIPVMELQAPAHLANVYVNVQTDHRGKVIAVQVNFGYTIRDIGGNDEDHTYSIPVAKVEGLLDSITDKMVTTWISYREAMG
jgi:hypothetical protein